MDENAIIIKNLKKKYILGQIDARTLTEDIHSWWIRRRGGKNRRNAITALEDIGRRDSFWALKGINLEIKRGDRVGIIGHNGAGKSTLLKILSRVTTPTEGRIEINGRIVSMLEVGTGFHGELTGRQNIYLNGAILGMKTRDIDNKLEDIIDFSECRKFIDTPVKRYSSGMSVKLGFAVAAYLDSEIMIMDEVLAVGDVAFQRKCLDKMAEIGEREKKTILYVSHNMSTVRRLCNQCIVLDQGEIKYKGNIEEGIQRYLKVSDSFDIHNDLTGRRLIDRQQFTEKMKFVSLDLLGNTNRFECGDPIAFELCCICDESVSAVRMRFIVGLKDDTRIGIAFSPIVERFAAGEIYRLRYEFDTRGLAPGQYSTHLILFGVDGAGNEEKFDCVSNAFCFEIVRTKGQYDNLEWNRPAWGSAVFHELKVL